MEKIRMKCQKVFHTIHNYIDTDEMILRKSTIAAHAGEKVLIPINMRDGSVWRWEKAIQNGMILRPMEQGVSCPEQKQGKP